MVEELIAAGWTPADIIDSLVNENGMSQGAAELYVQTALGGPGDAVITETVTAGADDAPAWRWSVTDLDGNV